jgi:hypothetical protein
MVAYLKPEKVGHDLNDVLKENGVEHLKAVISHQRSFASVGNNKEVMTRQIQIKDAKKQQISNKIIAQEKAISAPIKQPAQNKNHDREIGH